MAAMGWEELGKDSENPPDASPSSEEFPSLTFSLSSKQKTKTRTGTAEPQSVGGFLQVDLNLFLHTHTFIVVALAR